MILVTGGTGLVGAHLLYHLSKTCARKFALFIGLKKKLVSVKKVFSTYTDDAFFFAKIDWFKADITDVPAMIPAFVGIRESIPLCRIYFF